MEEELLRQIVSFASGIRFHSGGSGLCASFPDFQQLEEANKGSPVFLCQPFIRLWDRAFVFGPYLSHEAFLLKLPERKTCHRALIECVM
jgi:hypothetical protein